VKRRGIKKMDDEVLKSLGLTDIRSVKSFERWEGGDLADFLRESFDLKDKLDAWVEFCLTGSTVIDGVEYREVCREVKEEEKI
jgi:hypothetical protein